MKVVLVNRYFHPDHAATAQMSTDLALALSLSGFDMRVITSRQLYGDAGADLPVFSMLEGVSIQRVQTTTFGRRGLGGRAIDYLSFYFAARRALTKLLVAGDVVIAATDPPLLSVVLAGVAKRRGAVLVNWLHDLYPEVATTLGVRGSRGLFGIWIQRARDRSLSEANMNVVLGDRMANYLATRGVEEERIRIIHNWADGASLKPDLEGARVLRREWGLDGKMVVAYSGNMGRVHEFETLLVAALLLRVRPEIVFLYIGDGPRREWLMRQAKLRKLENVMFQPYQPREGLSASLNVGDVLLVSMNPDLEDYVVPSKFYGALAVGRPVLFVGDPRGEIAMLIHEWQCGAVVAAGDGERLARTISELMDDPERCRTMGNNARELLLKRFDRPLAMAKWNDLVSFIRCGS